MRYFIWGLILFGLALTLGATFFVAPNDILQLELQTWGLFICAIGIVAYFAKIIFELGK